MYSSADEQAERASAQHVDNRTREQKRWDAHVYAANELIRKISGLTRLNWLGEPNDPYGLHAVAGTTPPLAPHCLDVVSDLASDLDRELKALRIIGCREGGPAPRMPELKMIETTVVGSDRVIKLGKIA